MLFRYFKVLAKQPEPSEPPRSRPGRLYKTVAGPYQTLYGRHSPSVTSFLCQKAITSSCRLYRERGAGDEGDFALRIQFDSEGVLAACVTAGSLFRIINYDESAARGTPYEILRQETLCPCKAVAWRPAASGGSGEQTDIVCCPSGAQEPIALYNLETCNNNVPTRIVKRSPGWGLAEDALFLSHDVLCAGFRTGGRICLWDMRARTLQREFLGLQPRDELRCLCAVSPQSTGCGSDSSMAVMTAGTNGALRVWDLRYTARPKLEANCLASIQHSEGKSVHGHLLQLNALEVAPLMPGLVAFVASDCVRQLTVGLFDIQKKLLLSSVRSTFFNSAEVAAAINGNRNGGNGGNSTTELIRDVLYNRSDVHFLPQQLCEKAWLLGFTTPDGVTVAKFPCEAEGDNENSNDMTTKEMNESDFVAATATVVNTFDLEYCRSLAVHPFENTQMLCSSMWGGISVIT